MKKRLICVLLALVMLLSCVPVAFSANDTYSGSGTSADPWLIGNYNRSDVKAVLSGGTLTITGSGDTADFYVMVANGKESGVSPWSEYRDTITKVVVSGINKIGKQCFRRCTNLTEVELGTGLRTIGEDAFIGCTGLTSITLPDSVTTLEDGAFRDCSGLTSFTIPSKVDRIPMDCFRNCTSLKFVAIPSSVYSIGSLAFYGCTKLGQKRNALGKLEASAFTIGKNIKYVNSGAFGGCRYISEFIVENGNENYCAVDGMLLSKDKTTLVQTLWGAKSYTLSLKTVTTIDGAFAGSDYSTITLPDNVQTIGIYSFYGCEHLKKIVFTNSVTSINVRAFDQCPALETVEYKGTKKDRDTKLPAEKIANYNEPLLNATWVYETCADGKHVFSGSTCTICGYIKPFTVTFEMNGHGTQIASQTVAAETKITEPTAPTTDGMDFCGWYADKDLKTKFDFANTKITEDTVLYAKWGCAHNGKTEIRNISEPNCIKAGNTGDTYCLNCGEVIGYGTKIPATGVHTYDSGKVSNPVTCTTVGVTIYTCTACGAKKADEIPATGHSWNTGEITTAPTCAAEGVKTFTCLSCGGTKTEKVAKTTNHKWDDGVITFHPTTESVGYKTITCTVCGTKKSETIDKLTEPEPEYSLGDVNGDGEIKVDDARLALRRAINLESYAAGSVQFLACDVDINNKVTVDDARLILRVAIHLDKREDWHLPV